MASTDEDLPLGALVEKALGPLPANLTDKNAAKFTRGIANWYRANHTLVVGHALGERFEDAMSDVQKHIFLVLYEWWTASYQEAHLSLAAIKIFTLYCNDSKQGLTPSKPDEDPWDLVQRHLGVKRDPKSDINESPAPHARGVDMGQYHDSIRQLFRSEFLLSRDYDPMHEHEQQVGDRRLTRHEALQWAYCQKMAWKVYDAHKYLGDDTTLDGHGSQMTDTSPILADIEARFLSRGPVLKPCPWLETTTQQELPYYLFDTFSQCTVETHELNFRPEYTVISHTWGRWAKDQPVEVDGIKWKVPQNHRFEVKDLPHQLRKIPSKTRYVWFDLFCIPQDGSIKGMEEIARQATIFRNAKTAIAWINDVKSFDGLQQLVKWELLNLLPHSMHDPVACQKMIREIENGLAEKQTGLLKPREGSLHYGNSELNAWFTSLWTLQEVAMRPDIWLCASDWSFVTWDNKTPLPLAGLITIYERFYDTWEIPRNQMDHPDYGKQNPIGVKELFVWRFKSGLAKLLYLDQVSLIALGDRRECRERRAEAIMSALGVTEWFNKALNAAQQNEGTNIQASLEQDLVLGKYPLAFVQELCRKIPGDFFGAFFKQDIERVPRPPSLYGSLLPFDSRQTHYLDHYHYLGHSMAGMAPETHRSVLGWTVLATRQVCIPSAYILAASTWGGLRIPNVRILLTGEGPEYQRTAPEDSSLEPQTPVQRESTWTPLRLLIMDRENETFAVGVQYFQIKTEHRIMTRLSGIFIERLPSGSLVKSGNFLVEDLAGILNVDQCDQVDWTVN